MDLNLDKHREALLSAWKDVVNDRTSTDWAVFGYDGPNHDILKVVGTGDGGLEELGEELNSGRIMYAFCRVMDTNTSLPKYVLINWQGEGAPLGSKGKCANHVRPISTFFKGAHISIMARTEDEVEPSVIMDKLSHSTGSKYDFKEKPAVNHESKPVCSVYKRTIPTKEINPSERDKFWDLEEVEEKHRQQEERDKLEKTRKKLEDERINRERKEALARENWVMERQMSITKIREAEQKADSTTNKWAEDKSKEEHRQKEEQDRRDEVERRNKSEHLRRERQAEAQQLASQRTINARAIFEQNTSAGQLSSVQKKSNENKTNASKLLRNFEEMAAKNAAERAQERKESKEQIRVVDNPVKPARDVISPSNDVIKPAMTNFVTRTNDVARAYNDAIKNNDVTTTVNDAPKIKNNIAKVYNDAISASNDVRNFSHDVTSNAKSNGYAAQTKTETNEDKPLNGHVSPEEPKVFVAPQVVPKEVTSPPSTNTARNLLQEGLASVKIQQDSEEEEQEWQEEEDVAVAQKVVVPETNDESLYSDQQFEYSPQEENGAGIYEELNDPRVSVQDVKHTEVVHSFNGGHHYLQSEEDRHINNLATGQQGLRAKALYDYQAADDTEITFDPDDVITHIEQIDEGWWQGLGPDGTYGLFPANYVELLDN